MLEVAQQAMEQAKRRKDLVKAMSACAAGPKMVEEDDAKRNRASRTPSTITSTPSTKTPDPKAMKVIAPTPTKLSFQGLLVAHEHRCIS